MNIPTPSEIHELAIEKGWYTTPRELPELLCLIHSEISEALEAARHGLPAYCEGANGKPEGIGVELADAVIRIFDTCEHLNIDIESLIRLKHEYNKNRSFRHGNKIY